MDVTADQSRSVRHVGLDVTRAIAIFGVVVMNYHAYLNKSMAFFPESPSLAERIFNPLTGILSTRFAATFVLVAGIGTSLFLRRTMSSRNLDSTVQVRVQLARRGVFLFVLGSGLQWIWPGTIIFYYGAYFMIGGLIALWSTRRLIALSIGSVVVSSSLAAWRAFEFVNGNPTSWLSPSPNTPRNLLIRVFVDYTHPVFPWITFFCIGIVIGLSYEAFHVSRLQIAKWAGAALLVVYVIRTYTYPEFPITTTDVVLRRILSTNNHEHGLLHVASALATAILALCVISWLTDKKTESSFVNHLARAGRMSLSIYVIHVLVFNFFVNWMHWIRPTGLDTALLFSVGFYAVIIPAAAWWNKRCGAGPLERMYRMFGG